MNGIVHPYYTVALAPAIAASVGIGATLLWQNRFDIRAATALSGMVLVSTILACVLLSRHRRVAALAAGGVVAVGGVGAAALLLVAGRLNAAVAAVGGLPGNRGVSGGACCVLDRDGRDPAHEGRYRRSGPSGHGRWCRGGPAGCLTAPTPGPGLSATLAADAERLHLGRGGVGSNNAAGYQLASGAPVMAVGGFNGTDPVADAAGVPALRRRQADPLLHPRHG